MGLSFTRNQRVRITGEVWVLRRKIDDDCWQLENLSNGRIIERTRKDLLKLWDNRELSAVFESDDRPSKITTIRIPESAQETIDLRLQYVKAVNGLPISKHIYSEAIGRVWKRLTEQADSIVARNSLHAKRLRKKWDWTTVYRWSKRYRSLGQDSHALLHKTRYRKLKLPSRLLEILEDALDEIYLVRPRRTLRDTLDYALLNVKEENTKRVKQGLHPLPKPSLRMLNRVRGGIKAFDQYAARYGRQAAIAKFRSVKGHVITSAPLERAEIDHTPLDLFVVDDDNFLPLGRPYLTVCIDDHTRCILGIHLDFNEPSFLSVAQCLKAAFRPKDWIKEAYPEIENVDEIYGISVDIIVDQALEFHARDFVRACDRLGISVKYSARKTPWNKGKVERVVRTINDEVAHGAPGTTFSNIIEKGDYNPEKFAVVRLSTLKKAVYTWIYDVYHQRMHRALEMPPAEMWKKTIDADDIEIPRDRDALDAILGREHDRVLTHKGIEYEGLFYNSADLEELRRQFGHRLEVKIRVDESDLGNLHVLYLEHVFRVPALRKAYALGISLWQHKQFKRLAEKSNPDGWLKAKERIRADFQNEILLKRKRSRKIGRLVSGLKREKRPAPESPLHNARRPVPHGTRADAVATPAMPLARSVPKYAPVIRPRTEQHDAQMTS